METTELEKRIKAALVVLDEIKYEMPRTLGEPNFQLLYDDVCNAINKLKGV